MYKKILLSSAIAAAMGITSAAHAVTINDDAADALTYASEIKLDATNGTVLANAAAQDLVTDLGFSVAEGSTRFIRIDLSNSAEFAGVPASATFPTATLAAGGAGESYVILEVVGPVGGLADDAAITINTTGGIRVFNENTVTATYNLYETGTAAATNGTALATATDTVITFDSALIAEAGDVTELEISVATNSTVFDGDATASPIGSLTIGADADVLWTDSAATDLADLVAADTKLVVSGDFSAALDADDKLAAAMVTLDTQGAADTLTATEATWVLDEMALTDAVITYTVDGEATIVPGAYTGLYDVVADTTADTTDENLGVLGNLEKDGATTSANLVLTPTDEGGIFRNFVRISNTSSITGDVFVRLYNDLGDTVGFALGDVAGQATELGAQESTSLINVDALYDAAVAEDSTFNLGTDGRDKLRMIVEGNFTSINLDNVTVSRDNQSFSTFQ